MKLSIPAANTIQKRHSVRTYENQPLLPRDWDTLLEYLTETLMRSTMKFSFPKGWKELFYQADFYTPLSQELADTYAQPLEMVPLV